MIEWVILLVTLTLLWKWLTLMPANFPPGPPVLPFVGSFPYLKGQYIHHSLQRLCDQYGPIVGLKFGATFNVVAVCGPLVVDILKKEEFQGRNKTVRGQPARPGIVFMDGQHWKEQRRFTLRQLRDLGFGKTSAEGMIVEEARDFMKERLKGKTQIQVDGLFGTSAINVLWGIMGGRRFSYHDSKFEELLSLLRQSFRPENPSLGFLRSLPLMRRLAPRWTGAEEQVRVEEALKTFLQGEIEQHRRTLEPAAPRDFLDVYLIELSSPQRPPSFSDTTLTALCLDLFSAGAESVSHTLSWCLLYMVLHPDWQDRMWREVEEGLGKGEVVSSAEKDRFPQVQAFITEVTRCNTIAPITVPRRCTKTTTFHGYTIPTDTCLFLNLWSVMNDIEHWGDPQLFRPARFLDQEGNFNNDPWMVNFGAGSRSCVGESLARSFLFVFLVTLIREFEFQLAAGQELPSTTPQPGISMSPFPFTVHPIPRH